LTSTFHTSAKRSERLADNEIRGDDKDALTIIVERNDDSDQLSVSRPTKEYTRAVASRPVLDRSGQNRQDVGLGYTVAKDVRRTRVDVNVKSHVYSYRILLPFGNTVPITRVCQRVVLIQASGL
jgi:hypothetical protein